MSNPLPHLTARARVARQSQLAPGSPAHFAAQTELAGAVLARDVDRVLARGVGIPLDVAAATAARIMAAASTTGRGGTPSLSPAPTGTPQGETA